MSADVPIGPSKVDLARWRRDIVRHIEDFPRQYAALEHAMAAFGGEIDLRQFKDAYDTTSDMDAYNRVQALERALGRVQNFVAPAGNVHQAAKLVHESAREFIARYRSWVEPYLREGTEQEP